jgi:hypothetical protein
MAQGIDKQCFALRESLTRDFVRFMTQFTVYRYYVTSRRRRLRHGRRPAFAQRSEAGRWKNGVAHIAFIIDDKDAMYFRLKRPAQRIPRIGLLGGPPGNKS